MNKNQIKRIITDSIAPLAAEIVKDIRATIRTKKAIEPKQTSNDRETVKALREQVEILKSQLEPDKATNDDLLDQMYVRTIQRTYEIESKGSNVTFNTSERTYKALKASENTFYFVPGTPLTIGTAIKSAASSDCIVTAIKQVAGRIEVNTWTPDSTCQSYKESKTATGNNLSKDGTSISCKRDGDKIEILNRRYPANTILKLGEAFYIVTGSYQNGMLATHQIKPYEGLKSVAPMQGDRRPVDNTILPRNFSMYDGKIM